ncbi:LysR family transcriptional regulator [Oceanobacillus arenosus]|uniref:LysR family transcriptional regulator n=1 Tax=Oceanobacillus arenosus TaxID=1229153 RepID=A0A3D8PW07_9BACI|nr:LysR family transcriptional regulator [Oceanobacillus arenosus]RDW20330.1 LysR family transcriptional regulator [Oceanobacillus arenosus]
MEASKLKYFQAVAHIGHMTKAASKLNISQPALSKAIHHLEEELEIKLFNREGREIQLNEFGEILLEHVDRAFIEIKEGERIIKDLAGLEKGYISVAATFPHVFPLLMGEYLKSYPNVQIKQIQSSSTQMKLLIKNDKIDFGISTFPIIEEGIEWIPLADDEIFLTVPVDHPFSNRKSISLKETENERFIGLVEGYGFRDITDKFCREAGIEPNNLIEVEDSGAILKLVEMGYGISFTPRLSMLSEHPGIIAIPISFPNCKRTIGVAYKKKHYFSKASENFLHYIIDYFKNYSAEKS